jgi:predicted RNase H-like HicB family nuclease
MERYYAVIRKAPDSDYGVEFPDLPGCFTAGSTIDEAKEMAAEALRLHLDGLAEDGEAVPAASSLGAIEAMLNDQGRGEDFLAVVEMVAESASHKAVRVNVTIDEHLLARIDRATRERGMSRSAFLAEAARGALQAGDGGRGKPR